MVSLENEAHQVHKGLLALVDLLENQEEMVTLDQMVCQVVMDLQGQRVSVVKMVLLVYLGPLVILVPQEILVQLENLVTEDIQVQPVLLAPVAPLVLVALLALLVHVVTKVRLVNVVTME